MSQVKAHTQNGADHARCAAIYARVSTEDQSKGLWMLTQLGSWRKPIDSCSHYSRSIHN
jgi:predicted site-specific integrase-resolvase